MKILREVLIKTTLRHFSFIRLAKPQTSDNLFCWWDSGEIGCLTRCWWDCGTQASATENLWTPKKTAYRDFPGGPVVKKPPRNAEDAGLILGWGARIHHAWEWLSPRLATEDSLSHTEKDPSQINKRNFSKVSNKMRDYFKGEKKCTWAPRI